MTKTTVLENLLEQLRYTVKDGATGSR